MQQLLKDALSETCENLVHLTPFDVLLMCEYVFFSSTIFCFCMFDDALLQLNECLNK